MTAEIRVLSGTRAGLVLRVSAPAAVGRAADAVLRFDPEQDLEVSTRHALLDHDAHGWYVRDEGSRNGTFLNGRRISVARVRDGDRIVFGLNGPEIEFREAAGATPGRPAPDSATRTQPHYDLAGQNARLRWIVALLGLALLGSIGFALWSNARERSSWAQERLFLLARIDSVLTAGATSVAGLTGERAELAAALRSSQAELQRVRSALESSAGNDSTENVELRRRLQSALAALERQQLAASFDYGAAERAVRRAVTVLWVETGDGVVVTGTAFAVREDATLITARHVLANADGEIRPRRLAVQFSDSDQVWPARILRWSDDVDLALIKVDNIAGGVHPAPAFNLRPDTLGTGAPVMWIGFPLGGETWPQDPRTGRLARPLGSVGVVTAIGTDAVEIQGYGAVGASGSPILDANGRVVAVLTGGRASDDRLLVGVPATRAALLLAAPR